MKYLLKNEIFVFEKIGEDAKTKNHLLIEMRKKEDVEIGLYKAKIRAKNNSNNHGKQKLKNVFEIYCLKCCNVSL